jgi:5-methylcytosine-specific restriction enzyme A
MVEYLGQMICAGLDLVPGQADADGQSRTAIWFHLVRADAIDGLTSRTDASSALSMFDADFTPSLPAFQEEVAGYIPKRSSPADAHTRVIREAQASKSTVLKRANGHCESCRATAPFRTDNGEPYLETHSLRRLTDAGPDLPEYMVALCPNCHRRAHYSSDRHEFQQTLKNLVAQRRGS